MLLLIGDAARRLGLSASTVRVWVAQGKLRAVRTSRGVRLFDLDEIEAVAAQRETREA